MRRLGVSMPKMKAPFDELPVDLGRRSTELCADHSLQFITWTWVDHGMCLNVLKQYKRYVHSLL
jgi:hypothetical protein